MRAGRILILSCLLFSAGCDSSPTGTHPSSGTSTCIDFDDYARWVGEIPAGSRTVDVVVSGDLLYCTTTSGLQIWDVSNRTEPRRLGGLDFHAEEIAVKDGFAYVTDYQGRLRVIDVTDPTTPRTTAMVPLSGRPTEMVLDGPHAYVSDEAVGLTVVRVTDETSPEVVATFETSGGARGLDVKAPHVYLVDPFEGLLVVDVSRPDRPRLVGSCPTEPRGGVSVRESYAYVRGGGSLAVVDISDPRAPSEIAKARTGWFSVHPGIARVTARDSHVYLSDNISGVRIFDVSRPEAPENLGAVAIPDGLGLRNRVSLAGETAYVAAESTIAVVDVSHPHLPSRLRDIRIGNRGVIALDVTERWALAARDDIRFGREGGLEIYDLSNPVAPSRAATIGSDHRIVSVSIRGDLACLVDNAGSLFLLEIAEPIYESPVRGRVNTQFPLGKVVLESGYAYLAAGDSGLVVADVSDRDAPGVDTILTFSGSVDRLDVEAGYLYLSGDGLPLTVLDLARPARPRPVAEVGTLLRARDLDASGEWVYLVNDRDFTVVDAANPSSPRVVARLRHFPFWPSSRVIADGDLVYVSDAFNTKVIEVTRPDAPRLIGSLDSGARDIARVGDYLYFAYDGLGIRIYPGPCAP
jgi:hypothetical protein